MTAPTLKKRGFVHAFGDDIPLDEGVMAFKFAIGRVTDPAVLMPHLFELLDPGFAARVQPNDFVIAGKNFGCGKPHITGFIAMQALGMGVLCASMPSRALRGAVTKGLPILAQCAGVTDFASTGDEIEVDFVSGAASNYTRGTTAQFPGMPPVLLDIVRAGGAVGALRAWLETHPDLRATDSPAPLAGLPPGSAPVTLVRTAKPGAAA